jgi:tripartite-type tricarboxylate transporter receptor subunit TctC
MARLLSARMSETLGQSVFVENKPGNSGILAAGQVAKSAPDGYTLMMGVVSLNAIQPSLVADLPFDPVKDFAPVNLTASVPHFIVVHPSLAVNSVKELIAYAKANPGKISYPSAGNGTTPHIAGEMFRAMTGTDMVHVPYKSTGQSMPDLLAGRLQVGFDTLPTTATYVRQGKLRALAVTGARRLADFPNVPTVEEAGVPGYRFGTWYGVFAPAGTPATIVQKLHAEIAKALQSPEIHAKFAEMGVDDTVTRTPEDFAALVRSDIARFAKLVKDNNIRIE